MRSLAFLVLIVSIIAMPFSNSFMYSLEGEKACIEEYSYNHLLQNSSPYFSNSTRENNNSFTPNRNYSHRHVILQSYVFNEYNNIISCIIYETVITIQHASKIWNSSFAANSSPHHSRHKSPPPLISSLPRQNSILLI